MRLGLRHDMLCIKLSAMATKRRELLPDYIRKKVSDTLRDLAMARFDVPKYATFVAKVEEDRRSRRSRLLEPSSYEAGMEEGYRCAARYVDLRDRQSDRATSMERTALSKALSAARKELEQAVAKINSVRGERPTIDEDELISGLDFANDLQIQEQRNLAFWKGIEELFFRGEDISRLINYCASQREPDHIIPSFRAFQLLRFQQTQELLRRAANLDLWYKDEVRRFEAELDQVRRYLSSL